MNALSIRQPWCSLIAAGQKVIETRTWQTSYRGPLLICSGVAPVRFPDPDPFSLEAWAWGKQIPRGVAICVVELAICRPMVPEDESAACCRIYPGAFAWMLLNPRPIDPFPVKGRLKLFNVPDRLISFSSIRTRRLPPAA